MTRDRLIVSEESESELQSPSRREFLVHHAALAAASLLCSATFSSCSASTSERSSPPGKAELRGPAAPSASGKPTKSGPSTSKGKDVFATRSYVITGDCIKDTACVDACPVDAIHPRKNEANFSKVSQLYIDPVECIQCGACAPECPINAIFAAHELPREWKPWQEKNAQYFGR